MACIEQRRHTFIRLWGYKHGQGCRRRGHRRPWLHRANAPLSPAQVVAAGAGAGGRGFFTRPGSHSGRGAQTSPRLPPGPAPQEAATSPHPRLPCPAAAGMRLLVAPAHTQARGRQSPGCSLLNKLLQG